MTVCKFFMEGYCKYGERCKFEHVNAYSSRYDTHGSTDYSSGLRPTGLSILKGGNKSVSNKEHEHSYNQRNLQNSFSPAAQVSSFGSKCNIQEVMQVISKDIIHSEKGNQWQFSAYSPQKDLTNVPGLEDHSPEELRWQFYKALQNGTLPLCQAAVQQLSGHVTKINNDLKKKDSAYTIVEKWLREGQESHNATPTNPTNFLQPTGFSDVPQFYSADTQAVKDNSFSFIPPQQSNVPTASVFSDNQTSIPSPVDNLAYSLIEDLTQGELEAFKADRFVFGAIPMKPPPKELCKF